MKAPLLVFYVTADPVCPVEHGVALSRAHPAAKLVLVEGGGHELHRADWASIIDAIASQTNPNLNAHFH